MRTPNFFLQSFSFAVLAAGLMTGCQSNDSAPPPQVEVQTMIAKRQPITEHITADAVLSPLRQASIAPQVSAPVAKFFVQRGSKVRKGELLAVLDNHNLEAAVIDNQGSYDAAQAAYSTATKATVPEDTEKAKSDLAQAKANLDLNTQIVNSRKQLFAQGAIPGRDLDTAQAALVQAQTAFNIAQQHLAGLEHVSRAAAMKSAEGQLESAKGKYLAAQAELQFSEIRSPIDGVITDRPLYAGETATAGTPLLTVMDTSSLLAKAHLTQPQAQQLQVGDPASVSVPGIAAPVTGKVTLVSPALDPSSTTVEVWVQVPNPSGELKPGTSVGISVAAKTIPDALVVPASALLTGANGETSVMVVEADSLAHSQKVQAGIREGSMVQIVQGLNPGEEVIVSGEYGLPDKTKVKAMPAQGPGNASDGSQG